MKYFWRLGIILIFLGCNEGRIGDVSTSAPQVGKIAKLNEASGICYASTSNTLFVVNDKGTIFELEKDGTILNRGDFSYLSNHDFEGVAYEEVEDLLYIAVEGVDNLLVMSRDFDIKNEINIDRQDTHNRKILVKDNEHGIEGITIIDNQIYVANQSYEMLPDEDPSVVIKLSIQDDSASLEEVITLDAVVDMSGMAYYQGFLFVVSDNDKLLVKYDIDTQEIVSTLALSEISASLNDISVEGVAFDDEGNIYFVHDHKKEGAIYKFKY